MPTKRSDKLKRLVAVQRHLEQMAELDLADTARSRREVSDTIDIVADAMGSVHPMHRLFSGQYAVQLDRLAQKDQMLASIQQAHETRVMRERAKGDRLEESMRDARMAEEREESDNTIYDLVDQFVLSASPASGKLGE